jgi:hypothetical protein
MIDEPPVDADAIALACRLDIYEIEPAGVSSMLVCPALPEKEEINDNIRAGVSAETAFGQANRAYEIGHAGDVFAGAGIGLVHRAGRCDKGSKPARL